MARFRIILAQALLLSTLGVTSCAPAEPAEDADSAVADSAVRDSSGQSYAEAIATVCDADRLAGVDANDPLEAANTRENYLVEHVKNADGIYFLTLFRSKSAPERAQSLAREAEATHRSSCPLVATLRAEGESPAPAR